MRTSLHGEAVEPRGEVGNNAVAAGFVGGLAGQASAINVAAHRTSWNATRRNGRIKLTAF